MIRWIEKKFKLREHHTDIRTEFLAGITVFITMAYALATVPNMLEATGVDKHVMMTVMVLLIAAATLAMALYTNRPFALAPGLSSAGIVAAMISADHVPVRIAGGIVFWSGLLFLAITFLGLREAIVRAVPASLKYAVSAGIGIFIALIGARGAGIIAANEAKNSLVFENPGSPEVITAVFGFVILLILRAKRVPGDMVLSIRAAAIAGIPLGVTKLPEKIISMPASVGGQLFQIDILGALQVFYLPFLLALFVPDFFATVGTILGVGARAGYLDENGNFDGIDQCFQVDAAATSLGALFGMPGMTTYLESSAGIESGGKTGLTVVFTSICFLFALFFAPVALIIPSAATAPVLVYIGISMLEAMSHIKYDDVTESMPSFMCVVFTVLAGNIANGICTAILTYLVMKTAGGKTKEIHPFMYLLGAVSLLYFYTLF